MGASFPTRRRRKRRQRKNARSGAKAKRGRDRAVRRHLARIGLKGVALDDAEDVEREKIERERLGDIRLGFHLRALYGSMVLDSLSLPSPYRDEPL